MPQDYQTESFSAINSNFRGAFHYQGYFKAQNQHFYALFETENFYVLGKLVGFG